MDPALEMVMDDWEMGCPTDSAVKLTPPGNTCELRPLFDADVTTGDWKQKHDKPYITVHACSLPSSSKGASCMTDVIRAHLVFHDVPCAVILSTLLNHNLRSDWDTLFSSVKLLEVDEVGNQIIHFQLKRQMGFGSRRDMCQSWCIKQGQNERWSITINDVEHSNAPLKPDWLRVKTLVGGYEVWPTKSGTEMISVNQSDVGGSVPQRMANAFACKAPVEWHKKLRQYCLKRMKIA